MWRNTLTTKRLSPRELQVLRLGKIGMSPVEIATELNLSVKSISTYRRRACEKLGIEDMGKLLTLEIPL